jgi:hypothetical protein
MSDDPKDPPLDPELARAQELAQAAVAKLGVRLEDFTTLLGPDSMQQRIHAALTKPLPPPTRFFKKGEKPDAGPIVAKINEQLSTLGWLKLFIRFMLLVKEWTTCDSSRATESP